MTTPSMRPPSSGEVAPSDSAALDAQIDGAPAAGDSRARPFGLGAAARAVAMLTGSTYVSYLLGLIASAIIARHLGPDDYGRYAYLVWLSGLMVMLANNGLTTTGIRFVAESVGREAHDDAHRVHTRLRRLQWRDLLICTAVLAIAMPWIAPIGWHADRWWLAAVVAASAIPKALYLFDISVAKGWGRFDVEARVTVSVTIGTTLAIALAAWAGASLGVFLGLFVMAGLAHWTLSSRQLRSAGLQARQVGPMPASLRARVDRHLWWTVVLCVIAAFSNRSIETLMLNAYGSAADIGFFAIAVALSRGGADLLSAGPNAVVMPAMSHAYGRGGFPAVAGLMSRSIRYFTFLGIVLVGLGVGGAQAAILIMYGDQYQPAVNVLRVLMLAAGLTLPMGVLGALLSTTDHQKLRAAVAGLWLAIAALAAWALIPRWGLDGAMWACAGSSLLIYVAVLATISRWLAARPPRRELIRLFAAAAIAAALFVALAQAFDAPPAGFEPRAWRAVWQTLCGLGFVALFSVLTVVFRAWNQSDAGAIRALARRLPGLRRWQPAIERWTNRLPDSTD